MVEANKKEGDLAFDINGYYPLYLTEDEAKNASSLSSAHTHEIDGVTYYMPDGGVLGKDFFTELLGILTIGFKDRVRYLAGSLLLLKEPSSHKLYKP